MKRGVRGFTLLELMVVVAVLGILAIVLSQSLPFILGRVRDATRIKSLGEMQSVIGLYYADTGVYPTSGPGTTVVATYQDEFSNAVAGLVSSPLQVNATYIPSVTPTYYETLPVDPLPGLSTDQAVECSGNYRNYVYISDGAHYKLVFNCADEAGIDTTDSYADPATCGASVCSAWAVSDNMDCVTSGCNGYGWP